MARANVPVVDARDPAKVQQAFRAIDLILQGLQDKVEELQAQRVVVPVGEVEKAPDNAPVPLTITSTTNDDGSGNVVLTWSYIQGVRPAGEFMVLRKQGTSPLGVPELSDAVVTLPVTATKAEFVGLPAANNYRFGIAAARMTRRGLAVGPVQAPTASPDWADVGGGGAMGFGLTSGTLAQFAATTSAQLASILTDETGTGAAVFATNPVLVTPNLGTPSAVTLTNGTGLPVATGVAGLGASVAAFLANPTLANFNTMLSDADMPTAGIAEADVLALMTRSVRY